MPGSPGRRPQAWRIINNPHVINNQPRVINNPHVINNPPHDDDEHDDDVIRGVEPGVAGWRFRELGSKLALKPLLKGPF